MSGHSKWATIKHQKGATDVKRGKVFSRISKAIAIAVREGNSDDPNFNPKLRMMVDKAKASNMPKENIARAIDKGAGRIAGASYEELVFEGFGPNQVAMMIECVTDNRNRTNSEIKSLFDKQGGVLGSSGSTSYFFSRKGVLVLELPAGKNLEEMELELIDYDAQDIQSQGENRIAMVVEAARTHAISEQLSKAGYTVLEADIEMVASTPVELSEKPYNTFDRFLQIIDDHEDIQKIYHNARLVSSLA